MGAEPAIQGLVFELRHELSGVVMTFLIQNDMVLQGSILSLQLLLILSIKLAVLFFSGIVSGAVYP